MEEQKIADTGSQSHLIEPLGTPLEECKDVDKLQAIIARLYDIIDDIDTASDMCKPESTSYTRLVDTLQSQKSAYIVSDGYNLFVRT